MRQCHRSAYLPMGILKSGGDAVRQDDCVISPCQQKHRSSRDSVARRDADVRTHADRAA